MPQRRELGRGVELERLAACLKAGGEWAWPRLRQSRPCDRPRPSPVFSLQPPQQPAGWATKYRPQAAQDLCARRSPDTLQHPFSAGEGQACPGGVQSQVSILPGRASTCPIQMWNEPVVLCLQEAAWITVTLEQPPVVSASVSANCWEKPL